MHKRILTISILVLLLFSSVNVIGIDYEENINNIKTSEKTHHISFSQKIIQTEKDYFSVNISGANSFLKFPGRPILPFYSKTFKFPKGTKITDVEFIISEENIEMIEGKIEPASRPVPKISFNNLNQQEIDAFKEKYKTFEDESVYLSSNLYPEKWYDYEIRCGLDNEVDTVFLKIYCYPIRYSPLDSTLYTFDSFDIKISYEKPSRSSAFDNEYKLLILTPRRFKFSIMPLYIHKIKMGVDTKIKTLEQIYTEYNGRDKPEQIKLFIKDAKEKWNIKYVLLVGGLKSHFYAKDRDNKNEGTKAWHFPVRYSNINCADDGGYISDLYYADIYKYNESSSKYEFEDWDSNGNDIFLEGDYWTYEEVDLIPDVYYGRIPCRNVLEVRSIVNKIIRYEKPSIIREIVGDEWMKKMIAVGGVTTDYEDYYPDGEWLCNLTLEYMEDKITDPVRVYASNFSGPRPVAEDIIEEFSKGAGFVIFEGHGNARAWDTYWPNTSKNKNWCGGIENYDIPYLSNFGKLPIVIIGGCHNGIFNVTLIQAILDSDKISESNYHTYGWPIIMCLSWKFVNKPFGGAIASTGCTASGLAGVPPDTVSGGLESNFFYKIGKENVTHLAEAHSGSIVKYIDDFSLDVCDVYCITEYQLFGDPSLLIGGY